MHIGKSIWQNETLNHILKLLEYQKMQKIPLLHKEYLQNPTASILLDGEKPDVSG